MCSLLKPSEAEKKKITLSLKGECKFVWQTVALLTLTHYRWFLAWPLPDALSATLLGYTKYFVSAS